MLQLSPYSYLFRRALRLNKTLEQASVRKFVVEEASKQKVLSATYFESHLERVTDVGAFSNLEGQYELIAERTIEHLPIVGYELADAALIGDALYSKGYKQIFGDRKVPLLKSLVPKETESKAALAATYFGSLFFGHFWTDDSTLMLLAKEYGQLVRPNRELSPHQAELLELLELKPRAVTNLRAEKLSVFADISQAATRRRRFLSIRDSFDRKFNDGSPPSYGAFILRGTKGTPRSLDNEREIADRLAPSGFICVEPEKMSLDELGRALRGVQVVVGVEGSHLVHMLYTCAMGASLITLQPPFRFSNVLKNYTDCIGMKYGFIVGTPTQNGYVVDYDELEALIGRISSAPVPDPPV